MFKSILEISALWTGTVLFVENKMYYIFKIIHILLEKRDIDE